MTDRREIEELIGQLYPARIDGKLDRLCGLFGAAAQFRIVGTSDGKPIAIAANGSGEIRTWLAMMVKTFKLGNHKLLSVTIDAPRAAVHWRADIHSKITGVMVATELVDLLEVRSMHIESYTEFFVPC